MIMSPRSASDNLVQGAQLATKQNSDHSTYKVVLVPGLLEMLEEVLFVLSHPSQPDTCHFRLFAFLDC